MEQVQLCTFLQERPMQMFTSQHDKAAAVCDDVAYTQRNFKHGEECIFDKRMATK